MLIGLIGPASAGKLEVAKYLVVHHNFRPAFIASATYSSSTADDDEVYGQRSDSGSGVATYISQHRRWHELVSLCTFEGGENGAGQRSLTRPSRVRTADGKPLLFDDAQALLDHATSEWRDNIVTLDLTSRQDLEIGFDKRPFFLLVGVDAPVLLRWRRSVLQRQSAETHTTTHSPTLEEFLTADDAELYSAPPGASQQRSSYFPSTSPSSAATAAAPTPRTPVKNGGSAITRSTGTAINGVGVSAPPDTPSSTMGTSTIHHQVVQSNGLLSSRALASTALRELLQAATLVVQNPYTTVAALHSHLAGLSLASSHRLRPSWDTYFLSLCTLASLRSNCMKRRVGAVLVRNNRVLSTGYNGTPRGLLNCAEGGCARCNGAAAGGTALDECLCLHAEENALLECGRERGGADGTVLYCNTCPCLRCAVKIVQTGVREVVYQLAYSMDDRSRQIFREANVVFRQYQPM